MPTNTEHANSNTDNVVKKSKKTKKTPTPTSGDATSMDTVDTIDIDNMSPDDISAMFDTIEHDKKAKSEAAVPAQVIREKFIEPLFKSGRTTIAVATLNIAINRAFKLEGDAKIQNSSVRSAAGAHRVGTVDGVALIFPYPVHKDGTKMTDAEIAELKSHAKVDALTNADTDAAIDKAAADLVNH